MNQPSSHQEDLASELSNQGPTLVVVYASPLRKHRKQIGWEVDVKSSASRMFLSTRYSFLQALGLLFHYRQSIHVINGIWAEPVFFIVLMLACLFKIPCAIYSEAPASMCVSTWISHLKRPIQSLMVRWVGRRVMGLLAISWIAERAFVTLGFPQSKIYRFGYFEKMRQVNARPVAIDRTEIVYVGRLVKGKGIELLIEAAAPLLRDDPRLRLRIVGGGGMEPELRRLIHATGLAVQTVFTGVVPSGSVPASLERALMLVLPSEADGWGMVVNQALQAGTPVVVSDACGAAELVANGIDGYVFRAGDAENLSQCMRSLIDYPNPQQMRMAAVEAGRAVSAERAAPYLLQCLEHMLALRSDRPVPKWIFNCEPQPAGFSHDDFAPEPRLVH